MSVLKLIRTNVIYLRKETISTALPRKTSESSPEAGDSNVEKPRFTRVEHSLETGLRYLKSQAYKETYGDDPVWTHYRRNFKGQKAPDTRRDCYGFGKLNKGSPCPICRDEYLVLHFKNTDLLKQFISPHGGEIHSTRITGVCQKQHKNITVAIKKAKDYGLITFDVPHRLYDYSIYNKKKTSNKYSVENISEKKESSEKRTI